MVAFETPAIATEKKPIIVRQTRDNGEISWFERSVSKNSAADWLVIHELGMGGQIVNIEETKITVVTRIPGAVDTTEFKGKKEDLNILFKVVSGHISVNEHKSCIIEQVTEKLAGAKALVATTMGRIMVGQTQTKAALIAAFATEEEVKDKSKLQLFLELNTKDLLALCLMCEEDKISLGDGYVYIFVTEKSKDKAENIKKEMEV